MIDYLKLITDQEAVFSELFARYDKDRDLQIQKEFTLFDKEDREAPDVENVTMNDAAVFSDFVQATLVKTGVEVEVKGDSLKDKETSFFEDFFRNYILAVDEDLNRRDIASFLSWNVEQACVRGRIPARVTLRMEGDKFDPGLLPLDARFMVYDYGVKGYKWIAPKFTRSKSQISDEYGKEIGEKVQGNSVIVNDFWILNDVCEEWLFIDKVSLPVRKYPTYTELPFIIQTCPAGTMLREEDQLARTGESIFYLARGLFGVKNKMVSIWDTLNMYTLFGGMQKEVDSESTAKRPERTPYGKRFVVPVQKGTKGYFPMPISDIRMATRLEYSVIDQAIQDATLPRVSFGTLQAPTSGVGIAQLKEVEGKVFKPRVQALETFYQRLFQMVKTQYVNGKMNVKLGQPGFTKVVPYKELDKDVSINCRIAITSRMEDMANISMVAALGDLFSDDTKMRDYLHVDNPDEENMKKWAQLAERVSPLVAKFTIAKALAEMGETIKARLMAEEMGLTLDQLLSGQSETNPIEMQGPKQLLSMFGGGGGGARTQEPTIEKMEE